MNTYTPMPGAVPRSGKLLVVFAAILLLASAAVYGVASYFMLGNDTAALRNSAAAALKTDPGKTVDINIGRFTTFLVRNGSNLLDLPNEARAALSTVHGVEAGVYTLPGSTPIAPAKIFTATDSTMEARGWTRIVGVSQGDDIVAVYLKDNGSPSNLRCCVLVIHQRDMVVASARGDLRPLARLAAEKLREEHPEFFARL